MRSAFCCYVAANGHLLEYYEDDRPDREDKPARACAWQAWHADDCARRRRAAAGLVRREMESSLREGPVRERRKK